MKKRIKPKNIKATKELIKLYRSITMDNIKSLQLLGRLPMS